MMIRLKVMVSHPTQSRRALNWGSRQEEYVLSGADLLSSFTLLIYSNWGKTQKDLALLYLAVTSAHYQKMCFKLFEVLKISAYS